MLRSTPSSWRFAIGGALTVLVFLAACKPTPAGNDHCLVIAGKLFETFNRHDWEAMAELYADTASFLDPSFGTEYVRKTRAETVAKYAALQALFPDIHDEVIGMYASGDKVTVEFVSTGKANDTLAFRLPIVTVLTFKDDLIVKDATYYDLENP